MKEIYDYDEMLAITKRRVDAIHGGGDTKKYYLSVLALLDTICTREVRIYDLEKLRDDVLALIMSESEKRLFEIFNREKS